MRLIWTSHARDNLREIVSYIWNDNPPAARKIKARIEGLATRVARHPFMGRPGAIAGTREAVPHPSYRIVYQIDENTIFILAVIHTARQWPPVDEGGD